MIENKVTEGKEPPRFLDTEPFHYSKYYADKYECDLAVPGYIGIGSLVCYTPLVEAFALRLGRAIKLLTTPLSYSDYGSAKGEVDYPLWENNPYIQEIVNSNEIDPEIIELISAEMDNFCQYKHEIENICAPYGLRPRKLCGSLFLSPGEMQWGLNALSHLKRPVVCLCPYGRSSSLPGSPWHLEKWEHLIDALKDRVSFFQIGNDHFEKKILPVFTPETTVRQAMALVWASDAYIGFDTGISHIATALEKPALVLWDAVRKSALEEEKQLGFSVATMGRWAYPQNKNLVILGEKGDEILEACIDFVLRTVDTFYNPSGLARQMRG